MSSNIHLSHFIIYIKYMWDYIKSLCCLYNSNIDNSNIDNSNIDKSNIDNSNT